MKMSENSSRDSILRVVEVAGVITQDLGLGRIVGQTAVYLYISDMERSLDEMVDYLGLSKAALSIATRQLESLGLIRREWRKGDRKTYYRIVPHIGIALKEGLLSMAQSRLRSLVMELRQVESELEDVSDSKTDEETRLAASKVAQARKACESIACLVNAPLTHFLASEE